MAPTLSKDQFTFGGVGRPQGRHPHIHTILNFKLIDFEDMDKDIKFEFELCLKIVDRVQGREMINHSSIVHSSSQIWVKLSCINVCYWYLCALVSCESSLSIFLYLRLVLGNPWGLGNLFYPLNTHGEIEDFLFFA